MNKKNEIQMKLQAHSRFSPSGLGKLLQCPEYVSGPSTADAQHGTLLHKVMENGEGYEELTEFDKELIDISNERVEEVKELYLGFDTEDLEDLKEQKLDTAIDDVWGTLDRAIIDVEKKKILAIDYKFGVQQVEPTRSNFQAICYVLALFRKYPFVKSIAFCFIHPAIEGPNGFNAHLFEQKSVKMIDSMIREQLERIKNNKKLKPDPRICKFCEKLTTCKAVKTKIDYYFSDSRIDKEITGAMIDAAKLAKDKAESILNRARDNMINKSATYDGYKLIQVNKKNCKVTFKDVLESELPFEREALEKTPLRLNKLYNIIPGASKEFIVNFFEKKGKITYEEYQQMRRNIYSKAIKNIE